MRNPLGSEFVALFRLCIGFPVCLGAVIVLALLRRADLAIGLATGLGLFTLNAFLLFRAGRAVLRAASGRAATLAGLASAGRIMILAGALVFVARLGTPAFLASAGGLLFCQGAMHLGHMRSKGATRWTNTSGNG
jgi:hypothetical protein